MQIDSIEQQQGLWRMLAGQIHVLAGDVVATEHDGVELRAAFAEEADRIADPGVGQHLHTQRPQSVGVAGHVGAVVGKEGALPANRTQHANQIDVAHRARILIGSGRGGIDQQDAAAGAMGGSAPDAGVVGRGRL